MILFIMDQFIIMLILSTNWSKNYLKVYRIESYWTQRLVKWKKKNSPLDGLPIGGRKFRKLIHDLKNYVLDFSIMFVTAVAVLQSKTVRLLANFLVIVFVWCYFGIRIVKRKCMNEPLPSEMAIHNENEPPLVGAYRLEP